MNKYMPILFFILFCANSKAQINWQRTPSPNENVSCLTTDSTIIYAGTYTYGVFKSINDGTSWSNISLGLADSNINKIQSSTDNKIFVGTGTHGVYQYNGVNWIAINNGLPANNLVVTAFAKSAGGVMFMMATTGKIYKWDGNSWTDISFNFPSLGRDICISSTGSLYASAFASGIYKFDGVNNWTIVGGTMPNNFVTRFTISNNDTIVVACNSNNVFKCATSGGTWVSINNGLPAVNVNAILSDNQNNLIIATAASNGAIYRSINGGINWTLISSALFTTSFNCLTNGISGKLFAGASGVFKTQDIGNTWVDLNPGMVAPKSVSSFLCTQNGTYFCSTIYGPWRSTDNGNTWQLKNTNIAHFYVLQIIENAAGDILLHARNTVPKGAIYRSTNNGESWTQVAANGCDRYTKLKQHKADTIWAASQFSGATTLSYSINNGANWVNNPLTISAIWDIDFSKDHTIFIGSESEGVSRSSNGGQTFTLGVGNTIPWYGNVIEIETDANGVIFAGSDWWTNTLWFSSATENGDVWTKFTDPDLIVSGSQDLIFDLHNNAYLACENNGIRMAYNTIWNANTNWITSNNGLPSPTSYVNELNFDTSGYMYAVCYVGNGHNGGLYKSTTVINPPLSSTYTFTGNGNWSDASNWKNNSMPPPNLSGNAIIIINPISTGECIVDVSQQILNGAILKVVSGKKIRVNSSLTITQ
ncbi:MAG: WD40/YVTN/BNR-like repeat-containing protein [Ferruginibacter sp.]